MYEGVAQGGPRDGVKLSAPLAWDGLVLMKVTEGARHYYQGRYEWHRLNEHWVWKPDTIPKNLCRSQKRVPIFRKYPSIE